MDASDGQLSEYGHFQVISSDCEVLFSGDIEWLRNFMIKALQG